MRWSRPSVFLSLLVALAATGCRSTSSRSNGYETRTSSGSVSFELTPKGMEDGRFVVDLRANTHSGNLSEIDLKAAATLQVNDRTYKPSRASSLSGHHAGGSIAFEISPAPKTFEITLSGVRTMDDIKFHWP